MASSQPPLVTLDDTNPAIVYEPESLWRHLDRQDNVMNNTYAAGFTNATATLVFNGTQMYVFGVILAAPDTGLLVRAPAATFIMDGEAGPSMGSPFDGTTAEYAWQWFSWETLDPGQHTMVMRVDHGDDRSEAEWPFVLDYIQYTPLSSGSAAQTHSLAQPTDATPSIIVESGKGQADVGPIVGGVVGGIAGLALLTFAAFFLFVKRRRRGEGLALSKKEVDLLEQGPKAYVTMHPVSPPTTAAPSTTAAASSDAGGPMRHPPSGPSSTLASLSYENLSLATSLRQLPAKQPLGFPAPATTSATSSRPTTPGPATSSSASLSMPHSHSFQAAPSVKSQSTQQEVQIQGTVAAPRVFHTDSGVRFTPPAMEETSPQDDALSDMAFSEVPPEYTEH
ncbi:hypothetical protein VTO73DRAFT_3322 [Trametes versicolor]